MREALVASRVTVHVLITMTSGCSPDAAEWNPRPINSSVMESDSAWFKRQPRVVNETLGTDSDMRAKLSDEPIVVEHGGGGDHGCVLGAQDQRSQRHDLAPDVGQSFDLGPARPPSGPTTSATLSAPSSRAVRNGSAPSSHRTTV